MSGVREKISRMVRSVPFWGLVALLGLAGFVPGFRFGLKDDARIAIGSDTERILSTEVPRGFVNEEAGSYRGVEIGDTAGVLRQKMGEPLDDETGVFAPQLAYGKAWSGMGTFSCDSRRADGWRSWVYPEAVFEVVGGRVCAIQVGGSGWTTSGGVEGGDAMTTVSGRGDVSDCHKAGGGENPDYNQPLCEAVTRSGVRLSFGGDPVTSVTILSRAKFRAARD
jgi:hypothetical protein